MRYWLAGAWNFILTHYTYYTYCYLYMRKTMKLHRKSYKTAPPSPL